MPEQVHAEAELAVEEPRLDKRNFQVLAHGADLHAHAGLLTAAGEIGRMEQIEIGLRNFRVAHQGVHGTETGAHGEVAGIFFTYVDDEVFLAGRRRINRLRSQVNLFKVFQAFQALLADLDAHHVQHVAGRNRQFAAEDLVLGLEIAADLNFLDVGFFTVVQIDAQSLPLRNLDVTLAAVKILDEFGVLAQTVGFENISAVHRQAMHPELGFGMLVVMHAVETADDFRVGENFAAGDFHVADLVLAAFVHDELHVHDVRHRAVQLHIRDRKIKVAVVAVEICQPVFVAVKILLLEIAAAGEPGKRPALFRFEFRPQFLLLKIVGAENLDVRDFHLRAFLDVEGHDAVPGQFLDVQDVFYRRVGQAVFFIQLLHLLHVGEHLLLVQRLADLEGDLFLELRVAQLLVPLKPDFRDARTHLHDVGQHHAAVVGLLHRHADVVELAGAVKQMHVVLRQAGLVARAGFELDVGADELLADRRRADKLDIYAVNFWSRGLRQRDGRAAQNHGNTQRFDD